LGIAGGNLERDLNTVIGLADRHGTDGRIVRAWIDNSRYRKNWVLRVLHQRVFNQLSDPLIAVWGLAYKQDTNSTKNSPSLELIRHLSGFRVRAYDPVVRANSLTGLDLEEAESALAACEGADVLAIMTPWPEFAGISPVEIMSKMKGRIIIDPYRILAEGASHTEGITYITLGSPIRE
jgi:UDPglucose 6-dehydrogenase